MTISHKFKSIPMNGPRVTESGVSWFFELRNLIIQSKVETTYSTIHSIWITQNVKQLASVNIETLAPPGVIVESLA